MLYSTVSFLLFMLNLYCFETVIIAMRQAVPKNWSIYVVDLIHQKVVFSTHHAAVVGLTHHKVVVSQGRAEPTTFGGLNPPPFLQCIGWRYMHNIYLHHSVVQTVRMRVVLPL